MNYSFFKSVLKGLKSFAIAIAVVVLGGVVAALTNFHPEPGVQTYIWGAIGAAAIGGINTFINWLKNKDK